MALCDGDGEGDLRTAVNRQGCVRHVTALGSGKQEFCRFRRAEKGENNPGNLDDSGANELAVMQSDSVVSMTCGCGSGRAYN